MKKCFALVVLSLVSVLCLAAEPEKHTNDYASVLRSLDWGTEESYAVGHKNPDTDATCSAISYAYLMRALGYSVEPRVAGKLNNETKFVLKSFGTAVPQILSDASGQTIIMTDHSDYNQAAAGMKEASVIQVIDHHASGGVSTSKPLLMNVKPVGSTCTIIYTCFDEFGIPVTREMAGLMLSGILSDTENLSSSTVTRLDSIAVSALTPIAQIVDRNAYFREMADSAASYYGMTDIEIYRSDYKNYDKESTVLEIGVSCVNARSAEDADALKVRMKAAMAEELEEQGRAMVFCMIMNKTDRYTDIIWYGDGAEEAAEKAFGSSGGKGYIRLDRIMIRKKDFIPAIAKALSQHE